jgi:DNA-binding CsgD family transcriptional regulator
LQHFYDDPVYLEPDPKARRERDHVSVVEAAYELEPDDKTWLGRVLRALEPFLNQGLGVAAYYDLIEDGRHSMRHMTQVDSGPHVFEAAMKAVSLAPPETVPQLHRCRPCITHSEGRGMGPEFADLPEVRDVMWPIAGARDCVLLRASDPHESYVYFAACMPNVGRLPPKLRSHLEKLAAHIAAACRLRRALAKDATSTDPSGSSVDAILDTRGRLVHAEGPAADVSSRASIVVAAEQQLAARGRLRRENSERALELWQAMIAGRWSLVAQTDTDGKRMLLARRNEPNVASPRSLTARERALVHWTARGHPLRLIAYELGISPSTASAQRQRALRKLGIRTRAELLSLVAPPAGDDP